MTEECKHKLPEKTFREICDYLGGDLDAPACKEVKKHLESCPDCNEYIESIKKTVALYQKYEEPCGTTQECKEKIMKYLKSMHKDKS